MEEYLKGAKPSSGSRRSVLAAYDEDGSEITRYLAQSHEFDYENMVFREKDNFRGYMWCFDIGPDGRVYALAERNRYAISVFNADGSTDRIIEREFESVQRSEESARRLRELVDRCFRTAPFKAEYRLEDTEPVVPWFYRGLHVDDRGYLWVRHSRSDIDQPDGVMLTFDVFDSGGHFEKQVSFRCSEPGRYNGFFFIGNDRVLVVKSFVDSMRDWFGGGRGRIGAEDAEQPEAVEIICYQIRSSS